MIPVTVEKRPPVELITQEDQKDPQYPEDFENISQDGAQMLIMWPEIFIQSHKKMQKNKALNWHQSKNMPNALQQL